VSFDNSRFTFNPWNDYSGVVMEQGRVQTDSDWNEWLAELSRRTQAQTLDMLGRAVYPATTPYAFQITAASSASGNSIAIGPGRMYVDGLLAENHGLLPQAVWDPALAELSGSPQPPPLTDSDTIDYTQQPYYPDPDTSLLTASGPLLAYLDVWTRPVTYLQDPTLVDPAIGIDTTGRLQTVWQVKLMQVPASATWTCATPDSEIPYPPESTGLLTTGTVPSPSAGPCCLSTGTGFTGAENQFYRVEIHDPGIGTDSPSPSTFTSGATFKWSRENASVQTSVTTISLGSNSLSQPASVLQVLSLGPDQVLGFLPGNWIEITDESHQLNGVPGELHQIDSVDASNRTITLTTTLSSFSNGTPAADSYTRIVRWDQSGKIYEEDMTTVWWDLGAAGSNGTIPVPLADKTLVLENGITINFTGPASSSTGPTFNVGDFWTFAARTADGQVGPLTNAPPRGPHHHYTKLSIVSFSPLSNPDCRTQWPPASSEGGCGCCTCTVGVGGQYSTIQAAIKALPLTGGEVCILPGRYFEHVVLSDLSDVVIYGCGAQTRLASPSLNPAGAASAGQSPLLPAPGPDSGLAAVITVTGSQHIELRSFCVEAADQEVGILLDRAAPSPVVAPGEAEAYSDNEYSNLTGDTDVTIKDLVITASTLPAIAALHVELLMIDDNRVAMQDVASMYPAIYVSGREIHIDRNWVGLQDASNAADWIPTSVVDDLTAPASASAGAPAEPASPGPISEMHPARVQAPGGIQIGGWSSEVYVQDNEIEGGSGNGITLGSLLVLDQNGNSAGTTPPGVIVTKPDACSTTGTLQLPGTTGSGSTTQSFVAAGPLINIQIDRNRIRYMGLCGIGPVGFFDLDENAEVISVEDLSITANHITHTLLDSLEAKTVGEFDDAKTSAFAYGAICVPDVRNLIIYDNVIADFGKTPGAAQACGIFVLNAEMADISRNQIRETRDWALAASDKDASSGSLCGGIVILLATPPTFTSVNSLAAWSASAVAAPDRLDSNVDAKLSMPTYAPGLPALRVEHNVVRVAVGHALQAFGFGPFSIVNNHLSTGGTVAVREIQRVTTVQILNLGLSIELANLFSTFTGVASYTLSALPDRAGGALAASSNGTVLFANNICQLEARANRERGIASVMIASLDHVLFADNQTWIDGRGLCAIFDALLLAVSIQVNSNRLQESLGSVLLSGATLGLLNITTHNLSTYCLLAKGMAGKTIDQPNVTWVPSAACEELSRSLQAAH
jgi:Family of unknown function (DUF6519)